MKILFVIFFIVFLSAQNALHCQTLENYFNDNEPKERGLLQTSLHDGEYIYLGGSSFDNYLFQPSIIKIDTQGNVIWTTAINDNTEYPELIQGIKKMILSDAFIYSVYYHPQDPKATEIWKVNSLSGEIVWRRMLESRYVPEHILDYDSEQILIAFKESYNGSTYLTKFGFIDKQTGNMNANYKIGDLASDYGIGVDGNKDIYYTKSDSIFKVSASNPSLVLWKKRYESINVRTFHEVHIDEDNRVFLFGIRNTTFTRGKVVALNGFTGDLIWDFTVSANRDMAISDFKVTSGSIYATWKHTLHGGGYTDVWTTKIDKSTGIEQWHSSYNFQGIASNPPSLLREEAAHDIEIDQNGNVLLTGYYNAGVYGPATWGVLKLNGDTGMAIYELSVPQDLTTYHEASVGLSIHMINGKAYFLGNLETRQLMLRPISMPVLGELDSEMGKFSIIKYLTGNYKFPSKTVRIEEFQNKTLLLKQTGRYVTVGLYDNGINPVWETELKKLYMLFGSNLVITPDNRIVVTAYASQHADVLPYHAPWTDSLYTFVLNFSGKVLQESRFAEYGEIYQGRMSGTDIHVSGTEIFVFFKTGDNYFVRKIEDQSISEAVDLGITYDRSPKRLVFDETGTSIKIIGYKSEAGVKLVTLNKNTLSAVSTDLPIPFSRINDVLKLDHDDVVLSGFSGVREPIARYNLAQSKLVWLHTNTNQGEVFQSFRSNEPSILLSVGLKNNDAFLRKTNLENGMVFWTQFIPGDVSLKEFFHKAEFSQTKNKVALVGYQQPVSGIGNRGVFIDVMTVDGNIQHEIITKQSILAGDNEAFDIKTLSSGSTLVGGNLNHLIHKRAGFVYQLDIEPAKQCQSYSFATDAVICYGDSYLFAGVLRTQPGYYSQNYVTQHGCDSMLVLNLKVLYAEYTSIEAVICDGAEYAFGDQLLKESGFYSKHFQTIHGCDSIVYLDLSVLSPQIYNYSLAICSGSTYFFGNQSLSLPGDYMHAFRCDSVVHLTLTVTEIDNTVIKDGLTLIANQNNAFYQWFKNDTPIEGAHEQIFTPNESGNYKVKIDMSGCTVNSDSISIIILGLESNPLSTLLVYPNPSSDYLVIDIAESIPNLQVILYDQLGRVIFKDQFSGIKHHKINIGKIPKGTYNLYLTTESFYTIRKISIK